MMSKDNTSHWIDQSEIINYLYDVRKYPPLTRDEERELIKKIRNGCTKSLDLLIYSNLRFVITKAKEYQNQGLGLSDLINEGNIGLIKAAKKFNYEQNDVRFLSYAVWWIKQSIIQSLHDNSRTIRLPVNVINDMAKIKKELPNDYGGSINVNQLVGAPTLTYLDANFDDEGNSMYDVIADSNSVRPDIDFNGDKSILNDKLMRILSKLNKTEQYVITKYFGLDGESLSLQDISEDLELTKERVRQIKEKAIKKLRFYSKELFELL